MDSRQEAPRSIGAIASQRAAADVVVDGLLADVGARSNEMAKRGLDLFRTAFPSRAASWTAIDEQRFVVESRERLELILAITAAGDEDLSAELESVGAESALADASLPQLLVVLRIARDLLVQTSIEVAERRHPTRGLPLTLVLTRVLRTSDLLTDAVALGYWKVMVARGAPPQARPCDDGDG